MKTAEEYFEIYCDNPNTRVLLELFLVEVREDIIEHIGKSQNEVISQKYLDMMKLFGDRWDVVADMTKDMDKPLNRRSFSTSIEIYYSSLYRGWKGISKKDIIW